MNLTIQDLAAILTCFLLPLGFLWGLLEVRFSKINKKLEEMENRLNKRIDRVEIKLDKDFDKIETNFKEVHIELNNTYHRIVYIEGQLRPAQIIPFDDKNKPKKKVKGG